MQAQLSLRASQQSKSELIQNFDALVDRYAADGAQLLKVVADPEDFWHGKSVYVFGANSLSSDGETIDWFDPDKHGKKYPSRALGDSSLDGQYALAGSQEFVRAFENLAREQGMDVKVTSVNPARVVYGAVTSSGSLTSLICLAVLFCTAIMGWLSVRSRTQNILLLNGYSPQRLQRRDAQDLLLLALPSAAVTALCMGCVEGFVYGVAHLPQLMGVTALIFAVFTVLMLVALLLINLMTWPNINAVGRREPAYRRFTVPSAIAKYVVVVLVACTIPGLVSSAQVSLGRSDSAASWSLLSDQYTLRVNVPEATIQDEQALASYDQATVRALGSLESRNGVLLSYALENVKGLEGSGYDGALMVNRAYVDLLQQRLGLSFKKVEDSSFPGSQSLRAEYSFHQKDREDRGFTLLTVEDKTNSSGVTVPALSSQDSRLLNYKKPVLVVTESATQNLQPSFISAALTTGNIMVSQPASVRAAYNAEGIEQTLLSVDRAGEEHLYIAQLERNRYVAYLVGLAILCAALVIGTAINTYITLAARARNDFVLRTAGLPLRTIFSGYLLKEACIVCLCSVAALVLLLVQGAEYAFSALAAPLLYGTILALVLRLSFNRIFTATVHRRHV
ncbi:hypothetical protein [uncultured Rothia sp.]|uniref:hypothetical protein n=1 Tax=uncultured Rothia sp. TaxID=316088 RepID=UPI0028E7A386|nr:hypothetical protein [uncultured Rothia sp.]